MGELNQVTNECEVMKNQNAEKDSTIETLQVSSKQLNNSMSTLKSQLSAAQESVKQAIEREKDKEAAVLKAENDIMVIRQDLVQAKSETSRLTRDLEDNVEQIRALET